MASDLLTMIQSNTDKDGNITGITSKDMIELLNKMIPGKSKTTGKSKGKKKKASVPPAPVNLQEAPEGWLGPYELKYLHKPVPHPSGRGRVKAFKTFEEAVAMANSIENCAGITKFPRGYQVRIGCDLIDSADAPYTALASWLKQSHAPSGIADAPAPSAADAPAPSAADGAADGAADSADTRDKCAEAAIKRMTEPEPEPEPEPEEEDENSEQVEVTEINITVKGEKKTFLIDKEQNMYDPDTFEAIGKYNNGSIEK